MNGLQFGLWMTTQVAAGTLTKLQAAKYQRISEKYRALSKRSTGTKRLDLKKELEELKQSFVEQANATLQIVRNTVEKIHAGQEPPARPDGQEDRARLQQLKRLKHQRYQYSIAPLEDEIQNLKETERVRIQKELKDAMTPQARKAAEDREAAKLAKAAEQKKAKLAKTKEREVARQAAKEAKQEAQAKAKHAKAKARAKARRQQRNNKKSPIKATPLKRTARKTTGTET